jgi:D-3-phosphoglycerate dehydrogenase
VNQRILVTTSTFAVLDRAPVDLMEAAGYEVCLNPLKRRLSRSEITELLADEKVVGLVAGLEPLDRKVLSQSSLRVISRVGSGISNVDLDAARDLGIAVHSTPDGPTSAVTELTVGALLGLLREIPELNKDLHAGRWVKRTGGQIEGRMVLVVGFGSIGANVAKIFETLGAEVLVHDPYLSEGTCPYTVVSLSEGFAQADVISFHNSGEECLLKKKDLPRLKLGVLILNAARGGVVSESALLAGLERGIIGGAWLDVFVEEPYSGSLAGHKKVLLTPHVGSYTSECRTRMERHAVENLLAALALIETAV